MNKANDQKCTYCGAKLSWSTNSLDLVCEYCGSKYSKSDKYTNSPKALEDDINNQMRNYKGSDQYRAMMERAPHHAHKARSGVGDGGCVSGTVNFIIFIIVLYMVLIVS